jgi:hypothetical protein
LLLDFTNLIKQSEIKLHRSFALPDITAPIAEWLLTKDITAHLGTIVQPVVFLLLKRNVQKVLIPIVMKFLMPHNALSVLQA